MSLEDIDSLSEKELGQGGHADDHKKIVRGLKSLREEIKLSGVFHDFSVNSNGTVPNQIQSGQTLLIHNNGLNDAPASILSGRLKHGLPIASNGAVYLEVDSGGLFNEIGARCWFPSINPGRIALINWQTSITSARNKEPKDDIPYGAPHFVANQYGWNITVWGSANGNGPILHSETYSNPLPSDKDGLWSWSLIRDGSNVYVRRPDGSFTKSINDSQFLTRSSSWASWELYEPSQTTNPAEFAELWAI